MNGGDLTRSTFLAHRHYSGVRMQQGRVQLDADWNEQLDLTAHRARAEVFDAIGSAGIPKLGGGFEVTVSPGGDDLLLSPGRAWVGGLLCELDDDTTAVTDAPSATAATVASLVLDGIEIQPLDWVEVLSDGPDGSVVARVTAVDVTARTLDLDTSIGSLAGDLRLRRRASYARQPDLPAPDLTQQASDPDPRTLDLPDGSYLAYLDVWERAITALDDPSILEPALGGPDTATRSRVVWQVRLLDLSGVSAPIDCDTDLTAALAALAPSTGRMAARAEPPAGSADLCRPTPAGGYVGLENQLYRVHVHDLDGGRPVVVWSRENASVTTIWVSNVAADILEVVSIGRDAALGFKPGDWAELYDDARVLHGRPGTLVRLLNASGTQLRLDTATATGSTDITDFPLNPRVRRWDMTDPVTATGDDWLELENGVQVSFPAEGVYRRHDYWLVPARSATADVEWPRDSGKTPLPQLPAGIRRSTGKLAILTASGGTVSLLDCRDRFPALTELAAEDVTVANDVCALPGVETVQDAIDALCRANDLRRHNRLLHGYGIVCGLAVHCGDTTDEAPEETPRRFATVEPGVAIDCDGNDLDLSEPVVVDVLAELAALGDGVLNDNGDGEVSLVLRTDPDGGPVVAVTRYEPPDESAWLENTLLNDIYEDCVANLQRWIRRQLNPAKDADLEESQRAYQLRTALTNLATYTANPKSGGTVFVSETEHERLREFYEGLKQRLSSQTFCAMFDDARPYPDYPDSLRGIRTISGLEWHRRVRVTPGGDEAYTVGAGANPLTPGTLINRYDLRHGTLVSRIDPVMGKELEPGEQSSSTAAAVTDVAFSPDGRLLYAAVPTRDDNDTLFRVGEIAEGVVRWRPATTICGVRLVTLATTSVDPDHVYAVGMRKRASDSGRLSLRQYEGIGIWRIPVDNVPADLGPMPGTETLNPTGPLAISPRGHAVFTCAEPGNAASSYTILASMALPGGVPSTTRIEEGRDDLALTTERRSRGTTAWVVVGSGDERALVGYDAASLGQVSDRVPIDEPVGAIAMQGVQHRIVLAESDASSARVFEPRQGFIDALRLPVQVAPVSVAASQSPREVVVLNQLSNSLSVIDVDLVMGDSFDLEPLRAYRRAAVEAFVDLLGGFLQYLKDCICDHLLVNCPTRPDNRDLDLAAVSIRGRSVHKVCNFSRRRYVKSFPTVGYWLSLVPVLPLLRELIGQWCCAVLPDRFAKYSTADHDTADDRVPAEQILRLLEIAEAEDPLSRLRGGKQTIRSAGRLLARGEWDQATAKIRSFAQPETDTGTGAAVSPESDEIAQLRERLDALEEELERLKSTRTRTTTKSTRAKPAG